jgi:hypothetical protein
LFYRLRAPPRSKSSQSYFTTDDQSVSKSWFQGPCGSHDRIFIPVDIYEYCFIDCVRPLCQSQVKVTLRPTTSRSVSPGFKAHEGLTTLYSKKTLPRNRHQREHGCPIVALGQTTKKTLVASIVARLLVARQRPSFVDCYLTVWTSQYIDGVRE